MIQVASDVYMTSDVSSDVGRLNYVRRWLWRQTLSLV